MVVATDLSTASLKPMSLATTSIGSDLLGGSVDAPRLCGSQCKNCGEVYFPATAACTRCSTDDQHAFDLGGEGLLWSWTVQGFLPKTPYASGETPESFKPYGVGYVQMPCGLKVEGRLTIADPDSLAIGMPMRLVIQHFGEHDDHSVYAFAPMES